MDSLGRDIYRGTIGTPARTTVVSVTAAGAGDNTEANGIAIDLDARTKAEQALTVFIFGVTTLASAQTLSMLAKWQQADDSSFSVNAEDVGEVFPLTVIRGPGVVTAGAFFVRLTLNLQSVSRRYVRIQFTPDLSASGTDTATIQSVYLLGSPQTSPAPSFGSGF